MSKESSQKNRWDQAIEDAEDSITKLERKIESLKAAILAFRESKDAGKPWPNAA